jgi:general secretion pathway protein A
MYNDFFGLEEKPFSIAPDPRYLYMSEQHREALAHLIFGMNSDGGLVLLTGEVGTGKTTVCRCLLEQIPENTETAFILNPKLTVKELLATICDEFGIIYPQGNSSIKVFIDLINSYVMDAHAKGHKTVLIIDEAQNLSANVLEQLRLLTNLETNKQKLLQIILLGQPELRHKVSRPELRQLAQRITARYHLGPLSKKDVSAYVSHRLSVAGLKNRVFPSSTMVKLFHLSGGVPRLINILCDRALLGAYVQGQNTVNISTLTKAAQEVFGKGKIRVNRRKLSFLLLVLLLVIILGAVFTPTYLHQNIDQPPVAYMGSKSARMKPLSWPDEQPIHLSKSTAYQAIFNQWGISYNPAKDGDACAFALIHGLQCLNTRGSLGSIRNLNRTAVLRLLDSQGRIYYATLTSLSEDTASFTLGTETRTVALKDLESIWLGSYSLLWRTPHEFKGNIHPDDEGTMVQWLDRRLALLQGKTSRLKERSVFDDKLVRQVKKFQRDAGLTVDGIVGAKTIIHMNTASGIKVPLLTVKTGDR